MKKSLILFTFILSLFACKETKKPVVIDKKEEVVALKDTSEAGFEYLKDTAMVLSPPDTTATVATVATIATEEPEDDITAKDSINFDKYSVDVQEVTKKAPLDFSSYPDAKLFKTRITEAYNYRNKIVFGGHYIGTIFGCGASCIMGFIMDVRDGRIYDLPLGERNMCSWDIDKAISNPDSRLFISAICREDENSKTANYNAYVWNEEKKVFESVAQKEFLVKK